MEPETTSNQNTLRDYLRILFRQKAVILTVILTMTTTVFIGLKFETPVYEAQVKILVSAEKMVQSPLYKDIVGTRSTEVTVTQGEIVKSAPVIERTVKALGLYKRPFDYEGNYCSSWKRPLVELMASRQAKLFEKISEPAKNAYLFRAAVEELRKKIKVEPIRDTNTFTISVKDFDPEGAATIANTLSRSYLIYDLEQQLAEIQLKYGEKHPSVIQLRDNIAELAKTLHGQPVSIQDALGTASSKVVEQADAPIKPGGKSKALLFLLGFVTSLFIGVMLAVVFECMDQTFKTPQEIESVLGLPFLGAMPKKKKLWPQALQALADQMYLIMKGKGLKTVLIAGIDSASVSISMTTNLARELAARASKQVLLIDADLRSSIHSKESQLPTGFGLAEILEGKSSLDACIKTTGNFSVLVAGKTKLNPVTLIDSAAMSDLLKTAKEKFDMVFINAPSLMLHKDSETLAVYVDGTVVVVAEGKTRRQVAQAAIQPLKDKKANLVGVVLKDRTFVIPKFLYERI